MQTDMTRPCNRTEICGPFTPQRSYNYLNCTSSDYVQPWSECCCQPENVKLIGSHMVVIIAVIAIVSIILNIITFTTLCYVNFFYKRIRVKFGREFILLTNPIFLLIRHLNLLDLLYSTVALPTYWLDYYYGYFPLSANTCTLLSFFRKTVEYAEFATLREDFKYFSFYDIFSIRKKFTLFLNFYI